MDIKIIISKRTHNSLLRIQVRNTEHLESLKYSDILITLQILERGNQRVLCKYRNKTCLTIKTPNNNQRETGQLDIESHNLYFRGTDETKIIL